MDSGLEVMIFMGVILKIPVVAAAWLIWHAIRSEPEAAESAEDEGGSHDHRRYRREPKRPRGPRRGPHAPDALPIPCPEGESRLRVLRPPAGAPAAREREHHHR